MGPFASVDELIAGWRPLSEDEKVRAEELLMRASAYLSSLLAGQGVSPEGREAALRIVCCDLVQRKMEAAASVPVSSVTQQAGAFAQTIGFSRPTPRGWKLYPEDYALLGIKKKRAQSMRLAIYDREGECVDW